VGLGVFYLCKGRPADLWTVFSGFSGFSRVSGVSRFSGVRRVSGVRRLKAGQRGEEVVAQKALPELGEVSSIALVLVLGLLTDQKINTGFSYHAHGGRLPTTVEI
jgi:hypothetical protein